MTTPQRIIEEFQRVRRLPKEERSHGEYRWLPSAERLHRCKEILHEMADITTLFAKKEHQDIARDLTRMMEKHIELTHHQLDTLETIHNELPPEETNRIEKMFTATLEKSLEHLHQGKKSLLTKPELN